MDYNKKTIPQLKDICRGKGVKGYSGKSKAKIIELLTSQRTDTPLQMQQMQQMQQMPQMQQRYRVISLFSGMCGMDIGFAEQVVVHQSSVSPEFIESPHQIQGFVNLKRLPFDTVFQNDILPEAKRIAELNNWNHNYHLKDIRTLLNENFAFPNADVITGGFPCQDFSHAGKRQGFDAARGNLYESYVELVRRIKPILFVAENVNGLLTMPGAIETIVADFSAVGYEVKYQLIKCEEYGIPQTRWRVIIMGLRLDKKALSNSWNLITENKRRCTIRPYFSNLAEPNVTTDPAQQVYSKAARLAKGQGQKEVNLDGFSPTMRAEHHGNIEFRRITGGPEAGLERRLTVREAALIQTFPPDCVLTEVRPTSKAYKPIGNAVPPLLGYLIARKVREILGSLEA